jgi:hypothetical protein
MLIAGIVAATALLLSPVAARQDNFEAAVRAAADRGSAAPPSRPASRTAAPAPPDLITASGQLPPPTRGMLGPRRQKPAPAGALPAEFRTPLSGEVREAAHEVGVAGRAASQGIVDPVTWLTHHFGRLPLPESARPLRCAVDGLTATYTLGRESSPAYRAAIKAYLDEKRRNGWTRFEGVSQSLPRAIEIDMGAATIPETMATLDEYRAMLRASGYGHYHRPGNEERWRPLNAKGNTIALEVVLKPKALETVMICDREGIALPSGPLVKIHTAYLERGWTSWLKK